jgi:tetratricopeptide (TPR) repeat protein
MTTPATLKQQAAVLESKRQPEKALALYVQLLDQFGESEEVDTALRNRVGDLQLRLGHTDDAIALFARSAEDYALSGFLNNAIALCNKILRHRPGHVPTLRRLARFCGEKGLLLDAQRHYLAVAESLEREGRHGEALQALSEFAEVSPNDVQVRTVVVEQLLKAGRQGDALPHLTVLHRIHSAAGRTDEAQSVAELALVIDASWEPESSGTDGAPATSSAVADAGLVFLDADSDFSAMTASPSTVAGFEATAAVEPVVMGGGQVDGFESTAYGGEAGSVEAIDMDALEAPNGPPMPAVDFVDEAEPGAASVEGPAAAVPDALAAFAFDDVMASLGITGSGAPPSADAHDEPAAPPASFGSIASMPAFSFDDATVAGSAVDGAPTLSFDDAVSLPEPPAGGLQEAAAHGGFGYEAPPAAIPPAAGRGAEFVSLADLLGDDEARDSRMTVGEPVQSGDEDADLQRILAEFRAGIEQTIAHDDAESHYDLGIAFREMGLLDDAIAEFQLALRSPVRRLEAAEALGGCFVAKGDPAIARTVLLQGLAGTGASDDVLRGVLYLLGRAEEEIGARDEAVRYYQRVYAVDIRFRDVAARLQTLQQPT